MLFSIAATVAFVVTLFAVLIASAALPSEHSQEAGSALGRLVVSALVIALIAALRWSRPTGVSVRPTTRLWLTALPIVLYLVTVYPLLFTGGFGLNLDDPVLSTWVGLNVFAAAMQEELVFRGLILWVLVRQWGLKPAGMAKSLVLSSLLFSTPHAFNLLTDTDPGFVLAQLGWVFLLGGFLAMLILAGGSIWPAIAVHGLANVIVHLNRLGETVEPTALTGLVMVVAALPPVFYGLHLLRRSHR